MNALSNIVYNNLNFYDHINTNYPLTLELSFIESTISYYHMNIEFHSLLILLYLSNSFVDRFSYSILVKTMATSDNLLEILRNLERQKKEKESHLESLQLKARTLKRRKEEAAQSLAVISHQGAERLARAEAVRSRVETLQSQFSQSQGSLERSQEVVRDCARDTKDQANRRFEMIGEFEDEVVKLSEKFANHSLTGTSMRLTGNLNILAAEEAKASLDLEMASKKSATLETILFQDDAVEADVGQLIDSVRDFASEINR